jgi:hypothetical protein
MRKDVAMTIFQQIEAAFSGRDKPKSVVREDNPLTTEYEDALWFKDRDWHHVTWEGWEDHRDALFAFTPEAFAYYLPSVLSLSSTQPNRLFVPASCLLGILDRSPTPEYWDSILLTRLMGLKVTEYEALKAWLLLLTEHEMNWNGVSLGRAFDTVSLLQTETARLGNASR